MRKLIGKYRRLLWDNESLLAYSLLGVIGGVASGAVVLAFENFIVLLASLWGVADGEGFESLSPEMRFILPVSGALLLGLAYNFLRAEDRETGIVHVLSRMHSHYGALPARNALVQFLGGAFALATGQSGGREGPGVHLGGAVNSLLGQRLGLPNNSLRVLIACGTAGGIAAAFNTPLAGVIFAMEVIVAEYTVVGFIPVILAAVSASAFSATFAVGGATFNIPPLVLHSLWELPYLVLLGIACGGAVELFIRISAATARFAHWNVVVRFALAGSITGLLAQWVPEILGVGYDTLNYVLTHQIGLLLLATIAIAKLVATAISCGAGMPLGVIGPSLLIGACVGGFAGVAGQMAMPGIASDPTLYVVIGMCAVMGATMNAPLAALLAVIELTHTVSIGMPAMLAIVAATLTSGGFFRHRSFHQAVLRQLKRVVPDDPLNQLLHRTHVGAIMDSRVVRVPALLSNEDRVPLLEFSPTWCLVTREGEDLYLVRGTELLEWLHTLSLIPEHAVESAEQDEPAPADAAAAPGPVDLTEAGIRRWTFCPVTVQASLRHALDDISRNTVEAACIYERGKASGKAVLHGVVTRDDIEKFTLGRL